MTWRLALNRQRERRRRVFRESEPVQPPIESGVDDVVLARERAEQLWTAIDALPDKLRIVIILAAIEEHDLSQVSRLLDVPLGTVKSRLFLARRRLKDSLQWINTKTN